MAAGPGYVMRREQDNGAHLSLTGLANLPVVIRNPNSPIFVSHGT